VRRATVAAVLVSLTLATFTACSAERHESTTWTWRSLDPGPLGPREGVALGGDSRWLVAWGGIDSTGAMPQVLATGEVLDRGTGEWRPMATGPLAARHHALATWTDGRLVISGGSSEPNVNGVASLTDSATYDPSTDTWSTIEAVAAPLTAAPVDISASGDRLVATLPAEAGSTPKPITSSRIPLSATPAGDSMGELAQHRNGRRVDVLTSAVDRVRTFDLDRRHWVDGPPLPKPQTNAPIGGTIALTSISGRLLVLTAAQDLLRDASSTWRRVPRPPGTPALWERQAPVVVGDDIVVVSEPDPSEGAAGRHRLWLLSSTS